jgi:hypothetical protein
VGCCCCWHAAAQTQVLPLPAPLLQLGLLLLHCLVAWPLHLPAPWDPAAAAAAAAPQLLL